LILLLLLFLVIRQIGFPDTTLNARPIISLGHYLLLFLFLLVASFETLVNPPGRNLPDLDCFILAASDQLLAFFVPSHLGDGCCVSLKNVEGVSFLGVPESHETILVTRDYLTALVSPNDNTLLWLALGVSYAFS